MPTTKKAATRKAATGKTARPPLPVNENGIALLAGGNPQIPKGDGPASVLLYVDNMPGWKQDIGAWLHALIVKTLPTADMYVRWNSPFYGMPGQGVFVSMHCFTNFVRITWLFGQKLDPIPPGESKDKNARYLDVHEDDDLKVLTPQVRAWLQQGATMPGWMLGT